MKLCHVLKIPVTEYKLIQIYLAMRIWLYVFYKVNLPASFIILLSENVMFCMQRT